MTLTSTNDGVIFPNPAQDIAVIRLQHAGTHEVEVFGMDGRSHLRRTVYGPEGELSTASLANGTYLLRVSDGIGGSSIFRLTVAR